MNLEENLKKYDEIVEEINSFRPISVEQENRIMAKLRLEWNYHSNAIEGNSLSYGETKAFLMHGVTAKGKPFKDYLDIKGHDHVIDVLADIIRNKEELTEALIRELHKLLLIEPYTERILGSDGLIISRQIEIGKYKTSPNHVITATGKEFYFSTPESTPAKMNELIQWFRSERDNNELHPLVFASSFHHRFVSIHPFDDGNGRMARILMNLILMQAGYLPIVLRSDKRSEYFLALTNADEGDLSDLVNFVAEAGISSASIFLKAAKGEASDDLADFDKTLKLYAQGIQNVDSELKNLSQEVQNEIMDSFIGPLFMSVANRFEHIEKLFSQRSLTIIWFDSESVPKIIDEGVLNNRIRELSTVTSVVPVSKILLQYSAKGFVKNPAKDFLCNIEIYFHAKRFLATSLLTGTEVFELLTADYVVPPTEADAHEVAKRVLSEMVKSLKNIL